MSSLFLICFMWIKRLFYFGMPFRMSLIFISFETVLTFLKMYSRYIELVETLYSAMNSSIHFLGSQVFFILFYITILLWFWKYVHDGMKYNIWTEFRLQTWTASLIESIFIVCAYFTYHSCRNLLLYSFSFINYHPLRSL